MLTTFILTASAIALIIGLFGQPSLDYRDREFRSSLRARDGSRRRDRGARSPQPPAAQAPGDQPHATMHDPWIVDFAQHMKSTL
ncbi:hypothetical protein ACWDTI_02820 [Gordonia sp. NPDC003424]